MNSIGHYDMKTHTVRLSDWDAQKLRDMATHQGRTISDVLRYLVHQGLVARDIAIAERMERACIPIEDVS